MTNTPRLIRAKTNERKKYLLPLGDVHIGAPTCDFEKAKGMVDWALKENAWVIGMGDICETATRYSVGAGVYEQGIPPQAQQDMAVELLRPLAEKGLLLGMVVGNHEWRTANESGVDITKNICDILRVPYLGYSIFLDLQVGRTKYSLFATHGAGGSITLTGKINAITKLAQHREADIFLMGHVHELWTGSDVKLKINRKNKVVEEKKRYYVLTGAYLKYQNSYGELKSFPPSKTGSPRIRLEGDRYDPSISI